MNEHHQPFEDLRQHGNEGQEYWSARDLAPLLDYRDWRNFQNVLSRAALACETSHQQVSDHFVETTKMVVLGSGAQRELEDVHLSRYACYLVVQNGDPAKPVIAAGQTYFAIQTRRQELADDETFKRLREDEKRLFLRNELKEHNKQLVEVAQQAGVETTLDFAIFQNHGYQGLYGGLDQKAIHQHKGLRRVKKSSTIWGQRNWRPTCSAQRRQKRNFAGMRSSQSSRQTRLTLMLAGK